MMRQGRRASAGAALVLIAFMVLGVSAAPGETSSWEFDTPAYRFSPREYGSGPGEPHEFTLTNTGDSSLVAKAYGVRWLTAWPGEPSPFQVTSSDCHALVLAPGESCFVDVVFDPLHKWQWSGALMVKSEDEEVPIASVRLTGEGTGPAISATPDHLAFGPVEVGKETATQVVTLEEQAAVGYRIGDISIEAPDGLPAASSPFRIVGGTCSTGQVLYTKTPCTIELAMAPTEAGVFKSTLRILDDAPESPILVDLEGTATATPSAAPPSTAPPGGAEAAGVGSAPAPPTSAAPTSSPGRRACPKAKRTMDGRRHAACIKRRTHRRHRKASG